MSGKSCCSAVDATSEGDSRQVMTVATHTVRVWAYPTSSAKARSTRAPMREREDEEGRLALQRASRVAVAASAPPRAEARPSSWWRLARDWARRPRPSRYGASIHACTASSPEGPC